MSNIRQLWLLKDSKTWSKKDADYLVENFSYGENDIRPIKRVLRADGGIYHLNILGLESDSKKLVSQEAKFSNTSYTGVWKLGWTFFQKERESFYCRESLTYNLQRNLVDTGKNLDPNRISLVAHSLPKGSKYLFLEEHWPKFVDAFLGMCGVSKTIRRNFTGYNNKQGYGVFPASLALWRSTFFTAPSVLVGLMRNQDLFIKPKSESLSTIPEILEIILDDRAKSWETGGKRMYKYSNFGINSMLWFSLLWMNKIRDVCDNFSFDVSKHYADGPNNFVSCTKDSIAKILDNLDAEERKEIYLLLGGNDREIYDKIISNFPSTIRNVLCKESFGG